MKILFKYMLGISILIFTCCGISQALSYGDGEHDLGKDLPYIKNVSSIENLKCDWNTDLWNCTSINEDRRNDSDTHDTILRRLLKQFWLDYSKWKDLKFIDYLRAIINIALWLLSLVALIMTIYTFYMIFFSKDDAWVKKAKENLTWIFIALAIVWLAWIIISFIFRLYNDRRKSKETEIKESVITVATMQPFHKVYFIV